jgi:hypothetical protein
MRLLGAVAITAFLSGSSALAQVDEAAEVAGALVTAVSDRVGPDRILRLVVEYGSACESALRGPVVCVGTHSPRVVALTNAAAMIVGQQTSAPTMSVPERTALVRALPDVCRSTTVVPELLLIDEVTGPVERPVIVYRTLTMEPGSNCRTGGGGKIRLELVRKGDKFEKVSERVLEYY